jgi:hypothetical protein
MNPFSTTYEALADDFRYRGIAFDSPGFCDDPSFFEVERGDPHYLNHYASFVAKRPYEPNYLLRAKAIIDHAVSRLHAELVEHGKLGACVDISEILFRILEQEKIWSCCIKESLTITFPRIAEIDTTYFWSVDHGNFVAGHAWLRAPPYTVVDISVRQQSYRGNEAKYIPDRVMATDTRPAIVDVNDIVSPSVRRELLAYGVPPHQHLQKVAPLIPDIFDAFPATVVSGLNGASLKYSPVAIHAPEDKLPDMENMVFRGLTPWQLYHAKFTGKLPGNSALHQ